MTEVTGMEQGFGGGLYSVSRFDALVPGAWFFVPGPSCGPRGPESAEAAPDEGHTALFSFV